MACGCKKHKVGTIQEVDVPEDYNKPPEEACAVCADKHFSTAWQLAKESGYEHQNRRAVVGELVLLGWHLASIAPEFCQKVREIRHRWQVFNFQSAAPLWGPLSEELDVIFKSELEKETSTVKTATDVIIPLSSGSAAMNEELRFALRSIDKYAKGIRHVWIAGETLPSWVGNVKFSQCANIGRKQLNIHNAILSVMRNQECAERVIFWADDNALLSPLEAEDFPVVSTGESLLAAPADEVWWNKTRRETGELLQAHSFPTVSWEAHTPVVFDRKKYLKMAKEFNFTDSDNGLCYISMYLNRWRAAATALQSKVKATVTREFSPADLDGKLFVGYNNSGVKNGILDHFAELFPEPSKYEIGVSNEPVYPENPTIGAVLGTYDRPDLVELQLHYLCRINHLPVLVHDDASPKQEEVKAVVEKFKTEGHDVEFASTDKRAGHKPGDLYAFAAGLEWAKKRGLDLLYKVSHRWLIRREWVTDALELAKETDGLTFSSYTTNFNKGFRTEFQGMNVNAWHEYLPEFFNLASKNLHRTVEAELHQIAKRIAETKANKKCRDYMLSQKMEADKQGYVMIPWMGTDRKNPPADILWHDAAPDRRGDEMYAAELEKIKSVDNPAI